MSEKYFQIRVKSISYMSKPAIAVYFYNLTAQVKSIDIASKFLKVNQRKEQLCMGQVTMQEKFRSPLNSSLMLLQNLLGFNLSEQAK